MVMVMVTVIVIVIILQMWANSLAIVIQVSVVDDRTDISLELTNTRVSHGAALMPQSRT